MARHKGNSIFTLRKLFKTKGEPFFQAFLGRLSPEAKKDFLSAISVTWVDIEIYAEIIEKAAPLIYPNDSKCLEKLGTYLVKEHLPKLYKIFFPVFSLKFVITKSTRIWPHYYDTGASHIENFAVKEGGQGYRLTMVVTGFPELPKVLRKLVSGWIYGMMEICGETNFIIKLDESNPNAWSWTADNR